MVLFEGVKQGLINFLKITQALEELSIVLGIEFFFSPPLQHKSTEHLVRADISATALALSHPIPSNSRSAHAH